MKHLFIIFIVFFIYSCSTNNGSVDNRESAKAIEGCKDVPGLSWEYYERGMSAEEILQLANKLVLAGKADAKISKDAKLSTNTSTDIKSRLATEINTNVKQSSSVSDEFWEQEIAFQQTLCLLRAMQKDKTLSSPAKDQITQKILDFTSARVSYVLERKKKHLDTPK